MSKDKHVKFDVIIGNPPYQEETKDTSDKPICPYFMSGSYKVSGRVMLITPSRFLFNRGKTSKQWNQRMLSDTHLRVINYFKNSTNVFPNTDIKGGVCVTFHDMKNNFDPIGTFVPFDDLRSALHKVLSNNFKSIIDIIYLQNKFDLDALYKDHRELKQLIGSKGRERRLTSPIFSLPIFANEKDSKHQLKILGIIDNKRCYRYINAKYLELHINLNKFKVILPQSNGSGALGETLSTPLIGTPCVGFTQSFISFGAFSTEDEAENCMKYIKTKFTRAMLGTVKVTQSNAKPAWKYVPLQDFTSSSDIDWSKSIPEIDQQLYKKYGLNQKEIDFIEKHVKAMD